MSNESLAQQQEKSQMRKSNMLDLLLILVRQRKRIALVSLGVALITALTVFIVPPSYTSTATILSPQQSSLLSSALIGQLGALANLGGVGGGDSGGGLGFKSPQDTFIGILSSRTVADELIDHFHLADVYRKSNPVSTRKALARHTHLEAARGWLIRISVEDHNPQRAADIANGYVDALYRQNKRLALTEASQRRVFYEQQLTEERTLLNQAELSMVGLQEKTGIFDLGSQSALTVRSIAQISAEITSREVQLQSLRTVATGENTAVVSLEAQIAALKQRRDKLEQGSNLSISSDSMVPTSKMPQAGLEYLRELRNLRYHESLFELLSKQYELARVDEAKSPPLVQIVDRAIPITKKTWPPRLLLVALAFILSFLGACGGALLHEKWRVLSKIPETAEQLAAVSAELRRTVAR